MKILFLDDCPNRTQIFRNRFAPIHEVTCVSTAAAAVGKLMADSFALVMLDHDLEPEHYTGMVDDMLTRTGMAVVSFVTDSPQRFKETTFVVHSLNAWASLEMVGQLEDAGLRAWRWPFAWATMPVPLSTLTESHK